MADRTAIEWTDATLNPIVGCKVLSAGCAHCYAMTLAGGRMKNHPTRRGLTTMTSAGPVWNGQVRFNFEEIVRPLTWKRGRKIFVCAHADLFYEGVTQIMRDRVWAIMAMSPQHTYQVLTKRPDQMRAYIQALPARAEELGAIGEAMATTWGYAYRKDGIGQTVITALSGGQLPNVWLGVSAEDQENADERIPVLLDTPAAVHFVSLEPLLGQIDLGRLNTFRFRHAEVMNALTGELSGILGESAGHANALDWVIAGGESGPKARPMHPDWVREVRDDCAETDVAFFFKQWGEWVPTGFARETLLAAPGYVSDLSCSAETRIAGHGLEPAEILTRRGKRFAGNDLDGRAHHAFPENAA
jgi:protein gp37